MSYSYKACILSRSFAGIPGVIMADVDEEIKVQLKFCSARLPIPISAKFYILGVQEVFPVTFCLQLNDIYLTGTL